MSKAAKGKLAWYTDTVKKNYRNIKERNNERESNRIERLEVAKGNAEEAIRKVREWCVQKET